MKRTIESLQAGRALAALAVVVLHSSLAARDFGGPFAAHALFQHGYLGVDFFFVLSGFIIYHSTVGTGRTLRHYLTARFRRVYLPYWPVGIAIALLYTLLPHLSAGQRNWSWIPTLFLAPVDANPALSVAWTLKHEILFYVIFGVSYYARLLPWALAAWLIGILVYGQHLPFAAINAEFFMGIGAAILYRLRTAHWSLLLLAAAMCAAWIVAGADVEHRLWIGAMFAFLVAPIAQLEERGVVTVPKALTLLGAASYSLYLVHEPLISLSGRVLHSPWPIFVASLLASVCAGFAYRFLVEIRMVERRFNPEVFQGLGQAASTNDESLAESAEEPK